MVLFTIAVGGECDETATQLGSYGIRVMSAPWSLGGKPVGRAPEMSSEFDEIEASVRNGAEIECVTPTAADYEAFFDDILEKRVRRLLFIEPTGSHAALRAAEKAASNELVKFRGTELYVVSANGSSAAALPAVRLARTLRDNGAEAADAYVALKGFAPNAFYLPSPADADGFVVRSVTRMTANGPRLAFRARGDSTVAARLVRTLAETLAATPTDDKPNENSKTADTNAKSTAKSTDIRSNVKSVDNNTAVDPDTEFGATPAATPAATRADSEFNENSTIINYNTKFGATAGSVRSDGTLGATPAGTCSDVRLNVRTMYVAASGSGIKLADAVYARLCSVCRETPSLIFNRMQPYSLSRLGPDSAVISFD